MLAVSVFNLVLCWKVNGKSHSWMGLGAWVFTLVCAYRAVFPRIDVPRVCWFDSPLNWIIFGRSAATIAEVVWAAQMSYRMRQLKLLVLEGSPWVGRAAVSVVILAVIAEGCSWTNLVSENK